ncbi:hypothetical protein KY330_03315 [Candidatus Woesearchaeota archaeon]|nr:hypothetical protein [Candidatus Woesearchaeota archaeon]
MKKLTSILAALALTCSACGERPSDTWIENKIRSNIERKNQARCIEIRYSPISSSANVFSRRYYDYDGDGKTVEQYIVIGEFPIMIRWNAVRPGKKPRFDPRNVLRCQRYMTKEEQQRFDKEYQDLIKSFDWGTKPK